MYAAIEYGLRVDVFSPPLCSRFSQPGFELVIDGVDVSHSVISHVLRKARRGSPISSTTLAHNMTVNFET
jgi:hypothetical protein